MKKNIALFLILAGIIGFVWSQNQKKKYCILEERISNHNPVIRKINAQTGNEYLFSFWGNDEETGLQQWAEMQLEYRIETQSGMLVEEKAISASESEEKGGIRRAGNGDDVQYTAHRSEDIIINASLSEGDYFDIEVYENLPEKIYWFPVLFIVVFITGLILFLKARNTAANAKIKSSKKRIK
ncbi:hypothetical protein [Maribellus maritimus]|uniref:hypothetical protein n=1 Tax=Maribellus maritimus TaxID=2870838 RepID=UPI001EE9DF09|nr:hypothetical protein [Maribellus maritimus]MCG6186214.1 hypothetical protein [Maribellus maritimus]